MFKFPLVIVALALVTSVGQARNQTDNFPITSRSGEVEVAPGTTLTYAVRTNMAYQVLGLLKNGIVSRCTQAGWQHADFSVGNGYPACQFLQRTVPGVSLGAYAGLGSAWAGFGPSTGGYGATAIAGPGSAFAGISTPTRYFFSYECTALYFCYND